MRQDAKAEQRSQEQIARITTRELAHAKDAANVLLEEIGLSAYVFEVEPRNGPWQVRIDYASGGVWQSLTLSVESAELIEVVTNSETRQRLIARWREALALSTDPAN